MVDLLELQQDIFRNFPACKFSFTVIHLRSMEILKQHNRTIQNHITSRNHEHNGMTQRSICSYILFFKTACAAFRKPINT